MSSVYLKWDENVSIPHPSSKVESMSFPNNLILVERYQRILEIYKA